MAQTINETEPNDFINNSGVITISSIGDYAGNVSMIDYSSDRDFWILSHGSTSIDLKFSTTVYNWDIVFVLECYTDASYSNFESNQIWNGGDNPPLIDLNPERYYVIKVFNNNNDYDNTLTYTVMVEDGVLPVELTSFYSQIKGNAVTLNWNTTTEVKNYGFDIERKNKKGSWKKIGFVEGAGNSNSPKSYSFIDKNVTDGVYLYRLKQIDTDGSYEYSNEIDVTIKTTDKFALKQNYPNPFNPSTKIEYSIPYSENVLIKVYDVLGREVETLLNEYKNAGTYEIEFNATELTSGLYFYKIISGNKTETRKMMLVR